MAGSDPMGSPGLFVENCGCEAEGAEGVVAGLFSRVASRDIRWRVPSQGNCVDLHASVSNRIAIRRQSLISPMHRST